MDRMRDANQPWDIQSIQEGWDVIDASDDKVGDVSEVHPDYLTVSKGFIFTSERYIPVSAIDTVTDDRVYLNVTKDEIESRGWDHVPETGVYDRLDRTATTTGRVDRDVDTDMDTGTDTDTLRLREERLRADKERVQAGEVTVGKDVVTEQRTMDVPVEHDEVTVERHAVDPTRPARGDIGDDDREIRVPVSEERVNVEKEPVVYEEVDVRKRKARDTERVSDTVRREEARINKEGDVDDVDINAGERDVRREPPPPSN